ncbi:MAG: S49 family peptidase [Candidatus Marinimicrobia bacterium]|nr:S49 family peptidase [Candidatus Neomarinimicrobiota bacterium]
MPSYTRVAERFFNKPWALMPDKLMEVQEVLRTRMAGGKLSDDEIRQHVQAATNGQDGKPMGYVAVIRVHGVLAQRMNLMMEISGGTSTEIIRSKIREAVNDPEIGAILLDVDSPGGDVYGTAELADAIYRAREVKPIAAIANSLAASAAYWIAAAASDLYITPGGEAGSLGVWTVHWDESQWYESEGVKPTLISAGKYKVEGNPYEALGDDARGFIQKRVDEYYAMFITAVARYRGVKVSEVRGGFGEGRVVGAREAVEVGLADKVATFDEVVASLQKQVRSNSRQAGSKSGQSLRRAKIAQAKI